MTSVRSADLSTPGISATAWPVATRAILPGRSAAVRSMRAVTPARAACRQQRSGAVVVLDPGLAGQRLDGYGSAPGAGMAGRQHDDHGVHPEEPPLDPRIVGEPGRRVGDHGDIEIAGGHPAVQVRAQPGRQAPAEGTFLVQQAADRRGHHPGRQGRRRTDGQRPAGRPVAQVADGADRALGLVERDQGVAAEHLAGRCRAHPARVAFHQRHAESALQPGDLPGDGRLGVPELRRRRRQRAEPAHRHERPPHQQIHDASMPAAMRVAQS